MPDATNPLPEVSSSSAPPAVSPPARRLPPGLWSWGASLLILGGIVAVVAYGATRPEKPLLKTPPKLANVEVVTLTPEPYDETLVLPARLLADREATVSAELGGTLAAWLAEEGALVKQGQPIAALETATLQTQLDELAAERRTAEATVAVAGQHVAQAAVALDQASQQLTSSQLELDAASSSLELADKEYERARSLAEARIATQAELDIALNRQTQARVAVEQARQAQATARLAVRAAEVRLAAARVDVELDQARLREHDARLASLRVQLAKTSLAAPIDGYLEDQLVQPGEVVAPGQPLARLYDLAHIRARVDVADRYVPFLMPDDAVLDAFVAATMPGATRRLSASLVLPGLPKLTGGTHPSPELPAEIFYVSQSSDPNSNTFQVELRLPNPAGSLRQGIIGQARIVYLTYPEALVIPMRAVQVSDLGPRVLVIERAADKRTFARVRDVVPISIQNDRILVTGGLARGDELVVSGGKGLVDGEEVQIVVKDGRLNGDLLGTPSLPSRFPAQANNAAPAASP